MNMNNIRMGVIMKKVALAIALIGSVGIIGNAVAQHKEDKSFLVYCS